MNQKIYSGRILAVNRCVGAAIKGNAVVNNLPVILGLGIGKTKGRIHIALTNNMGHTQMIALYNDIVVFIELQMVYCIKFFSAAAK